MGKVFLIEFERARGKVKNASVMSQPGKVCKNSNQVEITSERSKFCA